MARESPANIAYVPFKTFLTSLDTLKQGIPDPIDRSVFGNQSGSTQGMLIASYKALGLINEGQHPQPILHRLVNPETRKDALKHIVQGEYADVLDLGPAGTQKQLDDILTGYGVGGDTKKKAKSFFLQAAEMAEIKVSPYFSPGRSSSNSNGGAAPRAPRQRRRSAKKPVVDAGASGRQDEGGAQPTDMLAKLLDKFPEFDPSWPDDLKAKWFDGFGKFHADLKK